MFKKIKTDFLAVFSFFRSFFEDFSGFYVVQREQHNI